MKKKVSKVWTFSSDSNRNVEYENLQFVDDTTFCDCRDRTRGVAADGSPQPCNWRGLRGYGWQGLNPSSHRGF